ncbi:MAG: hypothetical protein ACI9XO_003284 [Paraglaciecola sp.]|jgi:hypothetical protein
MTIQKVKTEIQNWDKMQQADLMHFLVELLTNDKFQLSEAWEKELDKREEAHKNGTSVGRPAREVLAKYTSR